MHCCNPQHQQHSSHVHSEVVIVVVAVISLSCGIRQLFLTITNRVLQKIALLLR